MKTMAIDPALFREVLGQYPTGVVVLTAMDADGRPVGMTVGSFTSVSLNPPLVAFLPDKASSSWKALRETGDAFCVNVLGAHQEDICRQIAMRKVDKFDGIGWTLSPAGNPLIDGAVASIDCVTHAIHDGGDHDIVVGEVLDLEVRSAAYPLLFFRGGYGSFRPLSLAAGDADLLDQLKLVDLARTHMEQLAADCDTEVTAIVRVEDELVLTASVGRTAIAVTPTRVGQRVPFMPPLGSAHVAWADPVVADRWIGNLTAEVGAEHQETFRAMLDRVRDRGCAVALGHRLSEQLELTTAQLNDGDPTVSAETLRDAVTQVSECYNPVDLPDTEAELRSVSAPVFNREGQVAFTLTTWGRPGNISAEEVDTYMRRTRHAAQLATQAIGGRSPAVAALAG